MQNNAQYFGNAYYVALFVVGAGTYLAVNISLSRVALRLQGRARLTSAAPPPVPGGPLLPVKVPYVAPRIRP